MGNRKQTDEIATVVDEFGFEFSEPPAKTEQRKGKHDDRYVAARKVCQAHPGKALKVIEYNSPSNAYNYAKAINNGEHRLFKEDYQAWTADAGK